MNIKQTLLIILSASATAAPAAGQLVAASEEPVDITGDAAEFQDNKAVWAGDVRVTQAEAILTTKRLEADLSDEGDFEKITAIGDVRYSNGKQAITGKRAVYDNIARTITISEDVLVTQGKQVMSAGKVIYWVDTGKVQFVPEPGKRIRGIFYTQSDDDQS